MQRLCDWVKGRSISVSYIYIYIQEMQLTDHLFFRSGPDCPWYPQIVYWHGIFQESIASRLQS